MTAGWMRLMASSVVLTLAVVALEAGGWVVITVIDVPDYVVVGKPVTLTYAVRQHGMHLLDGLNGRIEARAGTDVIRATAVGLSESGHYAVTFTPPTAGDWTVDILSGFGGQLNASRITLPAIDVGRPAPATSAAVRGLRLYVAKGCITCHAHAAVEARSVSAGPALTSKRYDPTYLTQFLARPPQVERFEPGRWQMPDLKLREREIVLLAAFINAEPRSATQP